MEENNFRQTCRTVNPLPCVFEKAVLTRQFCCRFLEKHNIAERETVGCTRSRAQQLCTHYLETLREASRFALGGEAGGRRTHGREIRIQCGGLQGLSALLEERATAADGQPDIAALLDTACERFGSIAALPLDRIMPGIARYRLRKRARKNR